MADRAGVTMGSDPEELLRSIERTREELALTVDTIAGRLDPKFVAKRSVGKVRDGAVGVFDGVRARFDHRVDPKLRELPKPVIGGGLAALAALAAVLYAANRRRRR